MGFGVSRLVGAMGIAFVFPGQGSQSVGMMAGFEDHAIVRTTFDEASAVLGEDLWALVTDGPEDALNQTVNTQPVMLTAGVAVWRAWQAAGGQRQRSWRDTASANTALVAKRALASTMPFRWCASSASDASLPPVLEPMAAILDSTARASPRHARKRQGQVVEAVNFNTPTDRYCRPSRGRRASDRHCHCERCKGGVIARVAVPQLTHETRR
jgi:[acyl-carrier-protein] S-malonyltransferase